MSNIDYRQLAVELFEIVEEQLTWFESQNQFLLDMKFPRVVDTYARVKHALCKAKSIFDMEEDNWTKNKPTIPGAYWVRGYSNDYPNEAALVEVCGQNGTLYCNLHENNSSSKFSSLDKYDDRFEWCGPLVLKGK